MAWGWLVVAWLAADCAFVVAWTLRAPRPDPDAEAASLGPEPVGAGRRPSR